MFFQRQDFKLHARNIYKKFRLKEVNYFFLEKYEKVNNLATLSFCYGIYDFGIVITI